MNVQDDQRKSTGNGLSEDELNFVKRIFASLLLANKNLSLYPYGHTICVNSVNQSYTQLMTFLQKYGTLRLEIEKDRIIYGGEVISAGIPEEGTLHFTLFRDGIQWLELMDGIEKKELNDILLIINKYTKLSAEPEGDIVTAFWEVSFPHMKYDVAEFFLGGDQAMENSTSDLTAGKATANQLREKDMDSQESQRDPAIDQATIMLTPPEKIELQEMIRLEEYAEPTAYMDALLDSLLQHREKENFSIILEVLSEEFSGSISRKDFIVTLKILEGLQYVINICKEEIPWAESSIEDFISNISGPDSLESLKDVWKDVYPEEAGLLGEIFRLLNPKAIHTIFPLLPLSQSAPIRQMLFDSITFLALRDMRPLELMLNNCNEGLLEEFVPVLIKINRSQSLKYLIKLTRHPSARIRYEAIKGVLKRDPARIKDIFNLINDKEDSIRQIILKQIGQSRDDVAEELLLSYIQKTKFHRTDRDYAIQCFRILGKCGSSRSVPFLREALFKWGLVPSFQRSTFRRCAAIALATLGINEAEHVLKRAGRSLRPSVRSIVKKVGQELTPGGGKRVE